MRHRCPICKKHTDSAEHADVPFCSERCRLFDLGAWASGKHVVSDPIFDEEELLEADRPAQQKGQHEPDETIQ